MNQPPINLSAEPIRLFKSDFLEHFTHISPMVVVLLWVPVVGAFLWRALTVWGDRASAVSVADGIVLHPGLVPSLEARARSAAGTGDPETDEASAEAL